MLVACDLFPRNFEIWDSQFTEAQTPIVTSPWSFAENLRKLCRDAGQSEAYDWNHAGLPQAGEVVEFAVFMLTKEVS